MYGTDESRLGRVQGLTEYGVEPEREAMSTLLFEHDPGAKGFGDEYMTWRPSNCGEMGGKLQSMHDIYPNYEYGARVLYA